jgi:tight adherence protein C
LSRALLLAFAAVPVAVLAARDLLAWATDVAAQRRERASGRGSGAPGRPLTRLLAAVGRRLGVLPAPADLAARLAAAGRPLGLEPTELMAVKGGAAVAGLVLVAPLLTALPSRLAVVVAAAALGAGYLAPDLWLRRRTRTRVRAIDAELAGVLDLLRVCVEAGLPLTRAAAEVGARHAGVLAGELGRLAAVSALGVPRAQALAQLQAAAPTPSVGALVAAIGRSERHGAPLAPALDALAADARAQHARALAEGSARAAPKIQLAVALLLVPAVMLLVGAVVLREIGVG